MASDPAAPAARRRGLDRANASIRQESLLPPEVRKPRIDPALVEALFRSGRTAAGTEMEEVGRLPSEALGRRCVIGLSLGSHLIPSLASSISTRAWAV